MLQATFSFIMPKRLKKSHTSTESVANGATFKETMAGVVHVTVDPDACVPLTRVRKVVRGRVLWSKTRFKLQGLELAPTMLS